MEVEQMTKGILPKQEMEAEQMTTELLHDFAPRIRVYKDGRVERLLKDDSVSPSFDSKTKVVSKDVFVSDSVSARLYRPEIPMGKLPVLVYFHGGAFCLYSASSSIYHTFLNSLVSEAACIAVSVDYRIAPEHPMPACYDDSWTAAQWVLSHSDGSGPDPWINEWANFGRVFLCGDSAGANIAHDIAARAEPGLFEGMAMVHPFFGDGEPNGLWDFLYPETTGLFDPRLNPVADPARMRRDWGACRRVLVCVGGKDFLRERGVKYYEVLREAQENGEWEGELEFMESKGRGHVFHLYKPHSFEAIELVKRVADFITKKS